MAAFRKESGTAKGRGFGTVDGVPSFLNRLKAWIANAPVDGGPGWYIIDDQSAAPTNPYIVCANQAGQPTNSSRAKIIQFYLSGTANIVVADFWLHWNITTHVGTRRIASFTLSTDENTEYGYNFRGGSDVLMLMTNVAGTWDWLYIDPWDADPLLCEADFTASLARAWPYEEGDPNGRVSNYERITGHWPYLNDGRLYVTFHAPGGGSTQVQLYSNAARTSIYLIAQTAQNGSSGLNGLTAQNNTSVGGQVSKSNANDPNANIVVDFRLQVGAGEGTLFTVGESYYIWDYETSDVTGYFKVESIDGDFLHISGLEANFTYPVGARISPYPYRWSIWGNQVTGGAGISSNLQIPMFSSISTPYGGGGSSRAVYDVLIQSLAKMAPNDKNKTAVMRPIVCEELNFSGAAGLHANRAYGRQRNIYISQLNGMAVMTFGRVINGQNYITFLISGNHAYLILDSESLS